MPQTKLKLKKNVSTQLAIMLVFLSGCVTPNPPSIDICQVDLPRDRVICFNSTTGAGPTFIPIDGTDKWTTVSPESKRQMDNYMRQLKRAIENCSNK